MHFSGICRYAVRLSYQQSSVGTQAGTDRLVVPSAMLLAGLGLGLSTFSASKLLATSGRRIRSMSF